MFLKARNTVCTRHMTSLWLFEHGADFHSSVGFFFICLELKTTLESMSLPAIFKGLKLATLLAQFLEPGADAATGQR